MRKGDDRAAWLRIDPLLANVRQHPRFKQILNSMEFRCSSASHLQNSNNSWFEPCAFVGWLKE